MDKGISDYISRMETVVAAAHAAMSKLTNENKLLKSRIQGEKVIDEKSLLHVMCILELEAMLSSKQKLTIRYQQLVFIVIFNTNDCTIFFNI
jgi:hypothetical protein